MSGAFDLRGVHDAPTCVCELVPGANGIGIWLWCKSCKVLLNVEMLHNSVSSRAIEVEKAAKAR